MECTGGRPGSRSRVRRTDGRLVAIGGEPRRSLCQDVSLHLEPLDLALQPGQRLPLSAVQYILAAGWLASVGSGVRHPVRDGLRIAVERSRKLCQLAPT